jgi:glycerate 2-kinase
MTVLLAFDKFKDSMSAEAACRAAAKGLSEAQPGWAVDLCPLTDGGDGFASILTRAAGGTEVAATVTGPRGRTVETAFGLVPAAGIPAAARELLGIRGDGAPIAIVEMASASGLSLLSAEERDPLQASSVGTGELLRAAAAHHPAAILLGVGGSATHDLGLGALEALGLRFRDQAGADLGALVPADWARVHSLAGRPAAGFPPVFIACDVDNPLLGPTGALAVYGPQKGITPARAPALEAESARMAALLAAAFHRGPELARAPGAGAAGGIAFGLVAALGATLVPGSALFGAWVDLDARIARADLVLTGEGRFDASSMNGKGPGLVVRRARELGRPVQVFAGQVQVPGPAPGFHQISRGADSLASALLHGEAMLASIVEVTFSR